MTQDIAIYGPNPASVSRDSGCFASHLIGAADLGNKVKGAVRGDEPAKRLTEVFQGPQYELFWAWPAKTDDASEIRYNISHYTSCHIGASSSGAWLSCSCPSVVEEDLSVEQAVAYIKEAEDAALEAGHSLTDTHYRPGLHYTRVRAESGQQVAGAPVLKPRL